MESYWLKNFKRLHSIALNGLAFSNDKYDKERYQELSAIALDMLAEIAQSPIECIEQLISVPSAKPGKLSKSGYDTPKIEVRGAVFRDNKITGTRRK